MKHKLRQCIVYGICFLLIVVPALLHAQTTDTTIYTVTKTHDFTVTGKGDASNWSAIEWLPLPHRTTAARHYQTKIKLLYSDSGIYCLYHCEDNKITSTFKEDFLDLWHGDVVEAFFWTDEKTPLYFEYELSPYNYELPILVPNFKGDFIGWRPWHYEGARKTQHATSIDSTATTTTAWTAEFFIPYELLKPMQNRKPQQGTKWRANFYRIDHDGGEAEWSWQLT